MASKKRKTDHVARASSDLLAEQVERLKELFPECVAEGRVDFEKLKATLGEIVDERPERYSFTWAGKRDAIRLLQVPSRATLKPCSGESVDWETTKNVFIEGENLEVLKLLYKSYAGRVKMIYIDPPYNTGNDFIYPDNFADPLDTYLKLTSQKDAAGNLLTSNPETSGRYHSAWLTMMYPRLFVARQLLQQNGMIFVSIDDHEVVDLRLLMNEVFGEENFVECFIWKKSYGGGAKEKHAVRQHEYVLAYAKDKNLIPDLWLPPDPEAESRYYKYRDDKYEKRGPYRIKPLEATKSMDRRENLVFPIPLPDGGEIRPERQWWWGRDRVMRALANGDLVFLKSGNKVSVQYKQYLHTEDGEKRGAKPFSIIDGIFTQQGTADLRALFDDELVMQFPKPAALIQHLLNVGTDTDTGDIVFDFFAGSATLAQGLMQLNRKDGGNRRFIVAQLPERTENQKLPTIADIGKERIRRVIKKLKAAAKGKRGLFKDREMPEDLGVRVYRLAESNYRPWRGVDERDGKKYAETMEAFADALVPGWKAEDVVLEVALKEGYSLSSAVEQMKEAKGNTVWHVTDNDSNQSFHICLDDKLKETSIKALELGKDDLFICRDAALTDEQAANLALQCRLKTI